MPGPTPPRRPAAAPMQPPAQRQRELAKLLIQLDGMLKKASELAASSRERVSVGGLGRYRVFTRKVRDFFALAAVTQERLDGAPPEMAEMTAAMTTALERMHTRMVVLFVEASGDFFALFARVRVLPIGTHEICGLELRGLLEIRKFLDDPLYDSKRGQELRTQADRIAGLMRTVMNRIPPLPDFGDAPSVGPKGAANKPLKAPRRTVDTPRRPAVAPGADRQAYPTGKQPSLKPSSPNGTASNGENTAGRTPDSRLEVRPLFLDDLEGDGQQE